MHRKYENKIHNFYLLPLILIIFALLTTQFDRQHKSSSDVSHNYFRKIRPNEEIDFQNSQKYDELQQTHFQIKTLKIKYFVINKKYINLKFISHFTIKHQAIYIYMLKNHKTLKQGSCWLLGNIRDLTNKK